MHAAPLAELVLARLLARPALNTPQAELLIRTLKQSGTSADGLAADTCCAAAKTPGWGASWNESTLTVLMHIVKMRPSMSQVCVLWLLSW